MNKSGEYLQFFASLRGVFALRFIIPNYHIIIIRSLSLHSLDSTKYASLIPNYTQLAAPLSLFPLSRRQLLLRGSFIKSKSKTVESILEAFSISAS